MPRVGRGRFLNGPVTFSSDWPPEGALRMAFLVHSWEGRLGLGALGESPCTRASRSGSPVRRRAQECQAIVSMSDCLAEAIDVQKNEWRESHRIIILLCENDWVEMP